MLNVGQNPLHHGARAAWGSGAAHVRTGQVAWAPTNWDASSDTDVVFHTPPFFSLSGFLAFLWSYMCVFMFFCVLLSCLIFSSLSGFTDFLSFFVFLIFVLQHSLCLFFCSGWVSAICTGEQGPRGIWLDITPWTNKKKQKQKENTLINTYFFYGVDLPNKLGLDSTIISWGLNRWIPRQKLRIYSNSKVYRSKSRSKYVKSI